MPSRPTGTSQRLGQTSANLLIMPVCLIWGGSDQKLANNKGNIFFWLLWNATECIYKPCINFQDRSEHWSPV